MFDDLPPRPFTVIAGFLGAGKTTLVNRILTQSTGTRYAVLVNDFGAINVDAGLIAAHDGQTLALTNGCICCSMADGFVQTMLTLMTDPEAFDHVIVEASGVAEPSKIMDFARLDPVLQPDAIVTLVDAETFVERLQDARVGTIVESQVRQGDMLVLNKSDLAAAEPCIDRLSKLNGNAPVLQCSHADLPLHAVLGLRLWTDQSNLQSSAHTKFHSVVLRTNSPIDVDAFQQWVQNLPGSVLRGKGQVQITEQGTMIWQCVGRRSNLTVDQASSQNRVSQQSTEMVLIATESLDHIALPTSDTGSITPAMS